MSTSGLEQVKWPALVFGSPNCVLMYFRSDEYLSTASPSGLRGWKELTEYYLIDSTGTRYHLENPEFLTPPSIFEQIVGRQLDVRWSLKEDGTLSAEEVRRLITRDFEENISVWQATDLEQLEERLREAKSMMDVMSVFA